MTLRLHVCEFCGSEYRSPWLAASCCDPISNDLDDTRGYD